MPRSLALLLLALLLAGCGGGSSVHSQFYGPGAAATIAEQTFRCRVQADSPELAKQIENYAREKLEPWLKFSPDNAGPATVDITFLGGDLPSSKWKPTVGGQVGISNYGSSVGVGVGVEQRTPKYPSLVMALAGPDGRRLWVGSCALDTSQDEAASQELAAYLALDRITAQLAKDLAPASP